MGKDEEIRALRSLAEKLKGADAELSRVSSEKKILSERVAELAQERGEALARLQNAGEREKEVLQLRADLTLARQQAAMIQERLERDLAALRSSAREREERLLSDQERLHADRERLQRDLAAAVQHYDPEKDADLRRLKENQEADLRRLKEDHEAVLRRLKESYEASLAKSRSDQEAELDKSKEISERALAELQRLRAVCGALERQSSSSRAQLEELKRVAGEWERTQERYKAEFVVLQRKWVEREKEIRAEVSAQSQQTLESEKKHLRIQAQDELNQRAARIADQLRQENVAEKSLMESKFRAELERETAARRQEL